MSENGTGMGTPPASSPTGAVTSDEVIKPSAYQGGKPKKVPSTGTVSDLLNKKGDK